MKKKLSVKVIMSLILSAVLFCMPIGAFMANRGNTVSVQAQEKMRVKQKHRLQEQKKKVNRKAQRCPAMTFLHRNVPVRKNAHSIRWIRNVRSAKRITAFVSM